MRIRRVELDGLFGYVDHEISLRLDAPTIITAPNGAGKTHLLALLRATLALDARTLLQTQFTRLRVDFQDEHAVEATRGVENERTIVTVTAFRGRVKLGRPLVLDQRLVDDAAAEVPSFLHRMPEDRWLDSRSGRVYSRQMAERRFRLRLDVVTAEMRERSPGVAQLCGDPRPVFIDTKRLDATADSGGHHEFGAVSGRDSTIAASRIHEYTARLRAEVSEARRQSIQATQSADLNFAARALAAAKKRVNEAHLHERYDRTVERYETLARNSLAIGEAPLEFPEVSSPTVRRILSVFLDDWDKRLEPLVPLNAKIQTLREILDKKLAPSGKVTTMSPQGMLEFRTFGGRRVKVISLSSGEQHLVALFTLLLFAAQPGSLVLIDEPEISFHASWKHDFLEDIYRVAKISDLQIVLATHSSGIINGRWDLTEELILNPSSDAQSTEIEADQIDEELDD